MRNIQDAIFLVMTKTGWGRREDFKATRKNVRRKAIVNEIGGNPPIITAAQNRMSGTPRRKQNKQKSKTTTLRSSWKWFEGQLRKRFNDCSTNLIVVLSVVASSQERAWFSTEATWSLRRLQESRRPGNRNRRPALTDGHSRSPALTLTDGHLRIPALTLTDDHSQSLALTVTDGHSQSPALTVTDGHSRRCSGCVPDSR